MVLRLVFWLGPAGALDYRRSPRAPWSPRGAHGSPRVPPGPPGGPMGPQGPTHGIPWDPLGSHKPPYGLPHGPQKPPNWKMINMYIRIRRPRQGSLGVLEQLSVSPSLPSPQDTQNPKISSLEGEGDRGGDQGEGGGGCKSLRPRRGPPGSPPGFPRVPPKAPPEMSPQAILCTLSSNWSSDLDLKLPG